MIDRVHAICLTGGSAYGLAAADGVMRWHEEHRAGFPVGPEPTSRRADRARCGDLRPRPRRRVRQSARRRASATGPCRGARRRRRRWVRSAPARARMAGGLQGGVGTASVTLADGIVVGALAVVNAAGQVIDPTTGLPGIPRADPAPPPVRGRSARRLVARHAATAPPLNTTIGVVATSAALTKAECAQVRRRRPRRAWPGRSGRCTRCSTATPSSAWRRVTTTITAGGSPGLRRPDTRTGDGQHLAGGRRRLLRRSPAPTP